MGHIVPPPTIQVPVGTLLPYCGTSAPDDPNRGSGWWLLCDGDAVSRTTYAELFGVVGTAFGSGDGSTTFNLPDLRGRTLVGLDNLGGVSADRITDSEADSLGGTLGAESVTLTGEQLPSKVILAGNSWVFFGLGTGGVTSPIDTDSAYGVGSGEAHPNLQPSLALGFIIRAKSDRLS